MNTNQNIVQLFLEAASRTPAATAFIRDGRSITYGALLEELRLTAAAYRAKGIGKGDKVLVFVPMSIDLYRVVLALFYIGACPVFLDEWVSMERLKHCCEVVPCKALIAKRKLRFLAFFIAQLRKIPLKTGPGVPVPGQGKVPVLASVGADDTALVTFTTGTTGIPKAADRTHTFLYAQYTALKPMLENGTRVSLVLLPVVVLINLALGKTTVLPPASFAAGKKDTFPFLAADISRNRVEELIASPALLQHLCAYLKRSPVPSLQQVLTGGGAVFPDMAALFRDTLPAAGCLVVYGSTEAEPIAHTGVAGLAGITADQVLDQGLPVGKPGAGISLALIPICDQPVSDMDMASFRQMWLGPGVAGEIVVSGDHVLKSYINNPAAVARHKILVSGEVWHRTGDAGILDSGGNLFLLGPCREIVRYGEHTWYPMILSYWLQQYCGVTRAALLLLEQKPVLVLQAAAPVPASLLQTALARLSLTGARLVYMAEIPTDPRHRTKTDYELLVRKLNR